MGLSLVEERDKIPGLEERSTIDYYCVRSMTIPYITYAEYRLAVVYTDFYRARHRHKVVTVKIASNILLE